MTRGKIEHAAVLLGGAIQIVEPVAIDLRSVESKLNPRQSIGGVG